MLLQRLNKKRMGEGDQRTKNSSWKWKIPYLKWKTQYEDRDIKLRKYSRKYSNKRKNRNQNGSNLNNKSKNEKREKMEGEENY